MKESVMSSEASKSKQNAAYTTELPAVYENTKLSDWEVMRGVIATALSTAVGGAIGYVIGSWGDKQNSRDAARFGGALLGSISAVLSARANFWPARRWQYDPNELTIPKAKKKMTFETDVISPLPRLQSQVINLPAVHAGQVQEQSVQQDLPERW